MSPHEIYTRGRQQAGKRRDVLLHGLGLDPFPGAGSDLGSRGRFYCDSEDTPRIVDLLGRRMPDAVDETVNRARRIVERRFDLLGFQGLDFGRDIDWSLDPVHGRRAPAAPWPAVAYLDFSTAGDHKIVWELNRHQVLVTLAKTYRLTGDERFAIALKELWYDWRRKNPYPVGMNWTSALEVASRAISWVWSGFLLEGTAADSPDFRQDLARELARAGWYIDRFSSTYFSPNTHLLGEGVALFLIGVRYPGLRQAGDWRKTGWDIILEAAKQQVRSDGAYFEQSTYYHVYALDFFLHARILAARNGVAIPEDLDETIRKMLSCLAMLSQAGALPRYGDDDGGRVFDGSRNRPEHLRDPLSTGAVLFRDAAFKAAAAGLTEETLWLLGPESAGAFDAIAADAPRPRAVEFPACGIYAMASPGTDKAGLAVSPAKPGRRRLPHQLFIDGGEQGFRGAGHGHADALSVQLAANGRLWLTDPGTCHYLGDDRFREKFRGTAAHNTLTVDGRHQADPTGPFSWGPLPRVEVRRWVAGEAFDLFEGRHLGYERLPDPVIHRRWVLRLGAQFWLVRDVAEGRGTHRFDISWHFPPDVALSTLGSAVVACRNGESLALVSSPDEAWTLTVGEDDYSPAYGLRVPAPVARWSANRTCPAEFVTAIGFGAEMAEARLTRMNDSTQGAVGYEYAARDERRWFFFAEDEGAWRAGEWASDAAALIFRAAPGGIRELILTGGSYVDYAGARALQARERQLRVECHTDGLGWQVAGPGGVLLNPEVLP
jgi:hypothetical protein